MVQVCGGPNVTSTRALDFETQRPRDSFVRFADSLTICSERLLGAQLVR